MKLEYSLTSYIKVNSKWIKDLNIRPDTTKLSEENIGRTVFNIYLKKKKKSQQDLFDPSPRIMKIKTKINKWDLIKLKSFLHSKGNHKEYEQTTLRMGGNSCK